MILNVSASGSLFPFFFLQFVMQRDLQLGAWHAESDTAAKQSLPGNIEIKGTASLDWLAVLFFHT